MPAKWLLGVSSLALAISEMPFNVSNTNLSSQLYCPEDSAGLMDEQIVY
jgi:hypothetical protein